MEYKKSCEICGKEINSTSKKQLDWNYMIHLASCKKNIKEKK